MTDLPTNAGGGEGLSPTHSLKEDLDTLFSAMIFGHIGSENNNLPGHIDCLLAVDRGVGVEVLVIGNWATRKRVEIGRTAVDAPEPEIFQTSFDGEETGVQYKVNVSNLMRNALTIVFDQDQEIETAAANYELFPHKLRFWALTDNEEGEEIVLIDDIDGGTEKFEKVREDILSIIGCEDIINNFDLTPEAITIDPSSSGDN